jgi:hypothetical protein
MTTNLTSLLIRALAAISACLAAGGQVAYGQNVVRGAVPGWPASSGYYAPQNVYRFTSGSPIVQAQFTPGGTTAYYAPPATSRMAYAVPAMGSYQVSYPGAAQPGVATTAFYGGHSGVKRVAYLAPQVVYRPVPVQVPITYYRPQVVYQPAAVGGVAVAPVTCQKATTCTTTTCGTSRSTCWRPFAWLWGGSNSNGCNTGCGTTTCNYGCAPAACAPTGCGAVPYYTTPPVIPTVVAPGTPFPAGVSPGVITTPTVPPPGTRLPSSVSPGTTIMPGGSFGADPASQPPRIPFGTTVPSNPNPIPSGGFGSGSGISPAPVNPAPFNPGSGGTRIGPDGRPFVDPNLRPVFPDPYSSGSTTESNSNNQPVMLTPPSSSAPVLGSGYRSETNGRPSLSQPENQPIAEPGMQPSRSPSLMAPPSSVQPLRDPHGDERKNLDNKAPQLITPGDRTAQADNRWAVVPAVWPVRDTRPSQPVFGHEPVRQVSDSSVSTIHAQRAMPSQELVPVHTQLDDGGWKSAK